MSSDPRPGARGGQVLVSVETSVGEAGIVLGPEPDAYWLLKDLREPGSAFIEEFEVAMSASATSKALGGRLPAVASTASVRRVDGVWVSANCANGAWIVALEEPVFGVSDPLALFRDPTGGVVAQPVPSDAVHRPAETTGLECPACGETHWEIVEYAIDLPQAATGLSREDAELFGPEDNPSRNDHNYTRCTRCGHREPIAVEYEEEPRPYSFPERSEVAERDYRAASFPLYGLGETWDGNRMVGSWWWDPDNADGRLNCVVLVHERERAGETVTVDVSSERIQESLRESELVDCARRAL